MNNVHQPHVGITKTAMYLRNSPDIQASSSCNRIVHRGPQRLLIQMIFSPSEYCHSTGTHCSTFYQSRLNTLIITRNKKVDCYVSHILLCRPFMKLMQVLQRMSFLLENQPYCTSRPMINRIVHLPNEYDIGSPSQSIVIVLLSLSE